MDDNTSQLKSLGIARAKFTGLETFKAPAHIETVTCISDEVTALCPVTGQPDWYQVEIEYDVRERCVESKTLKLYLQSFRDGGHFCENFSSIIASEIAKALNPFRVQVIVRQKPRGGVAIISKSTINKAAIERIINQAKP